MPKLSDILDVRLEELVERLWGEKVGDPCPCGCGGRKTFPTSQTTHKLLIKLPCAECGTERPYPQGKRDRHRKLCPTCAKTVERIEFTCVGYNDHDTTRHASTCPRTIQLRPSDVNSRQWVKKHVPISRFDTHSRTYQCNSCAGANRLIAAKEKELRRIFAVQNPHVNVEKIRSRKQRLDRLRVYHSEISPNFRPNNEAQKLGRKNFAKSGEAGKRWPNMTKANLLRRWSGKELPKRIRFGLCIECGKLAITMSLKPPLFHWSCHQKWETTPEGRNFQSLRVRGLEASLLPTRLRPWRPTTEESLKKSYSCAIQHYLAKKSYRTIARETYLDSKAVRRRIVSLIDKLPDPDLVGFRFQQAVRLLLDASRAAL